MSQNNYKLPAPMINEREIALLKELEGRYSKLSEQTKIAKIGEKAKAIVVDRVPDSVFEYINELKQNLSEREFVTQALKYLEESITTLEGYAANVTVSEKAVLKKTNKRIGENQIESLDEICLVRAYEISKIVGNYKRSHILTATLEGGVTGAFGFAGIIPNLVASLFIYFRAVQSIAMFYGYDVKNDASELDIAAEVLMSAISVQASTANNEITAAIGKFMAFSETTAVKEASKRTWAAMIEQGGLGLLITRIRALANKAAQKALAKAGKKGLEGTVFKGMLTQLGKMLGLKNVGRAMPGVSAIFGALFDTTQMKRIVNYADIFYCKRFIEEKGVRINTLVIPEEVGTIEDLMSAEIIDADFEIEKEDSLSDDKSTGRGKYIIKKTESGIQFDLKAANGEAIATSEIYKTRASCMNGINSVMKNAPIANLEDQTVEGYEKCKNPKFEVYVDKAGEFRFRLKAKNGQIIAIGEGYKAKKNCVNGIESVRKNATTQTIEEK